MVDAGSVPEAKPLHPDGAVAKRHEASRPRGGVVTQRTANPRTPVQFRASREYPQHPITQDQGRSLTASPFLAVWLWASLLLP